MNLCNNSDQKHCFPMINVCQVPWELLKTEAKTEGLGFQHLPRDLANFNAWKTIFDPYNSISIVTIEATVVVVPLWLPPV